MQGIGPGTILGGRYSVDDRIASYQGAERWTGRDTILKRAVVLFVVPRGHPNADAVLDAARRSAGLDNPRLARILDVGTTDDLAFLVEEGLNGAQTLTELLQAGSLPAPEVRRIAGEAALLLDLARHRGLHHQRLTPDLVLRTSDGDIKLRGVAVAAALAGIDHVDHAVAARADAQAVVALAYAGFTGHWPLPGDGGGLPPAPRMSAHIAAPSEITAGVPADLDALCRLTFSNDQGPLTPGDFARQIAPWSPIPVLMPPMGAGGLNPHLRRPEQRDDKSPSMPGGKRPGETPSTARAPMGPPPRPTSIPKTPEPDPSAKVAHRVPAPLPRPAAPPPTADPASQATASKTSATLPDRRQAGLPPVPGTAPRVLPPAVAKGGATKEGAGTLRGVTDRLESWSSMLRDRVADVTDDLRDIKDDVMAKRARAAEARAERQALEPERQARLQAAVASSASSATEQHDDEPPTTKQPAPKQSPSTQSLPKPTRPKRPGTGTSPVRPERPSAPERPAASMAAPTEIGRGVDANRLEPPVPLLPPSSAEPLTRDQSRMAIGILIGALVLALAFAVWGLSSMPGLPGLTSGDGQTLTTPTADDDDPDGATGTEDGGDAPPTDAPPAQSQPLTFTAAKDYDPLGDGAENPDRLPRILDGDTESWWGSEGYRNSAFSNLKQGLGIVLDLGESSSVSAVTLELPGATKGTLYVTDDAGYFSDGKPLADDLAKAGEFDGEGSVSTTLVEGSTGRYVIVWFTEVSKDGDWYRARLAGASATS